MRVIIFSVFIAESLAVCQLSNLPANWRNLKNQLNKSNIYEFEGDSPGNVDYWSRIKPKEKSFYFSIKTIDYRWENFKNTFDDVLKSPFAIGLSLRLQDKSTIYLNDQAIEFTSDDVNIDNKKKFQLRKGLWYHFELRVTKHCFPEITSMLGYTNECYRGNTNDNSSVHLKINDTYNDWKIHKYEVIEKNERQFNFKTKQSKLIYFAITTNKSSSLHFSKPGENFKDAKIKFVMPVVDYGWNLYLLSCEESITQISFASGSGGSFIFAKEYYAPENKVNWQRITETTLIKTTSKPTTTTVNPTKETTTTIKPVTKTAKPTKRPTTPIKSVTEIVKTTTTTTQSSTVKRTFSPPATTEKIHEETNSTAVNHENISPFTILIIIMIILITICAIILVIVVLTKKF